MKCPKCGKENEDNWPILQGDGGCQECWENECGEAWWNFIGKDSE